MRNNIMAIAKNCRCTLIPMLTGIPELEEDNDISNLKSRNTSNLENMTYEEWKKSKPKSKSILNQKQTSENIKQKFIDQYKKAATRLK